LGEKLDPSDLCITKYSVLTEPSFVGEPSYCGTHGVILGRRSNGSIRAVVLVTVIIIGIIGAFWREGVVAPWSPDFGAQPLSAAMIHAENSRITSGAKPSTPRVANIVTRFRDREACAVPA
jgi:hypothetical protein